MAIVGATARGDEGGGPRDAARAASSATERATHWRPWWRKFHLLEGIVALTAEGIAIGAYGNARTAGAMWTGPAPLDSEIRDTFRLTSRSDRELVQDISDVMLQVFIYYPIVVDAFLIAGMVRQDWDTMLQMMLIDAAAMAIGNLITAVTSRFVGRERPAAEECQRDPQYHRGCNDPGIGPITSFVSGHALTMFLSSGLVCSHHINHPWLTGSQEGAIVMCGAALTLATVGSTMRIMSDLHWASDVVIGAAIGALIGFGLPLGLHYRPRPPGGRTRGTRETGAIWISAVPSYDGQRAALDVVGAF